MDDVHLVKHSLAVNAIDGIQQDVYRLSQFSKPLRALVLTHLMLMLLTHSQTFFSWEKILTHPILNVVPRELAHQL